MRLQNPFAALNTTGIDSQILVVLARTEQYLTVAQIHGLLPEVGSPEGVRKSVARLTRQGTVLERVTGRSAAYALNREHLLAQPILTIANAKQELIHRIAQVISGWEVHPLVVTLFGSAARDEMAEDSDIDLLIVMPDAIDHLHTIALVDDLASRTKQWTGNDVRPLLYLSGEVQRAAIFDSILAEGVDIAGDPSWLRKRLRNTSS